MKKIGLIGCGNIAETYLRSQEYFNNINIIACADINKVASDECAKKNHIKSLTVNELLNDDSIEIVLNLTIPQAHYDVSKKSLESGKHVYSEKPMAINLTDAKKLLDSANKNKLYY